MNRKPGLVMIMMITLFLTIGFQCEEGGYVAIRDISQVDIYDRVTDQVLLPPVVTNTDSLALLISFEVEHFSLHGFSIDLMNEAWADCPATTCMANEITDIRVFCDKEIYNLPPNTNLSGVLAFKVRDLAEPLSLIEFLDILPGLNEDYYFEIFEEFTVNFPSKPAPDVYNFSIEIEDNNSHVFTSTAPPVDWQ